MIPILCVDDCGGVQFHRRRQSRDRVLRADLLRETAGHPLWMTADSAAQFAPSDPVLRSEAPLLQAGPEEFCFVEGAPLLPHLSRMEGLILYRWGRIYPADVHLDLSPDAPPWHLVRRQTFAGSSHPCITKEVYTR